MLLRVRVTLGVCVCAALALSSTAQAADHNAGPARSTATDTAELTAGGMATATADCPEGTVALGGGFSVSPRFDAHGTADPGDDTGARSRVQITKPTSGSSSWLTTASSFVASGPTGTLTTYARCLPNRKLHHNLIASELIPHNGLIHTFACDYSPDRVIGGGYETSNPFVFGDAASSELTMIASRATSRYRWSLVGFNYGDTVQTFTLHIVCMRPPYGHMTRVKANTRLVNDGRTTVAARCPHGSHSLSGGYAVAPLPQVGDPDIEASVDENRPVGDRTWRVSMFEYGDQTPLARTMLNAFVYCQRNR